MLQVNNLWCAFWAWYWGWPAPLRRTFWAITGIFGDNLVGALIGSTPSNVFLIALKNSVVQGWGLLHPLLSGLS